MWLSDTTAAGTMSQKVHGFRKILAMLLVFRTAVLIIAGNALGFFTGPENVIPISVDLSDFYGSFNVEGKTTIKICMSHDVLLINEVHNVIKRNSIFEIQTTV